MYSIESDMGEASVLLTSLHGRILRKVREVTNEHHEGLGAAARSLALQGVISPKCKMHMLGIDLVNAWIRHVTVPWCEGLYKEVVEQLVYPKEVVEQLVHPKEKGGEMGFYIGEEMQDANVQTDAHTDDDEVVGPCDRPAQSKHEFFQLVAWAEEADKLDEFGGGANMMCETKDEVADKVGKDAKDLISCTCQLSKQSSREGSKGASLLHRNNEQPVAAASSNYHPASSEKVSPGRRQTIFQTQQPRLISCEDKMSKGATGAIGKNKIPGQYKASPQVQLGIQLQTDHRVTTLMICNIPCKMTLQSMEDLITLQGFGGKYDFLYLPRKGYRSGNLGYAFINFPDGEVAAQFAAKLEGFEISRMGIRTKKVIMIRPARLQGYSTNIAKFRDMGTRADGLELFIKPDIVTQELPLQR